MTEYVFDTYAVMEIIFGNKNYNNFIDSDFLINDFIFAELCYNLTKINYKNMDYYLEKYKKYLYQLNSNLIKEAMKFRYENKKKKMSMADCISYFQAKKLGIKFLTGDKEFENLENVEFVK